MSLDYYLSKRADSVIDESADVSPTGDSAWAVAEGDRRAVPARWVKS
jgi:hypothetical protein